jgi:hypothetical protein
VYSGEAAWKAIGDRLQRPNHWSRVVHDYKIRNRRQKADIGKYSFVNRTIQLWSKLPMNASKPSTCRNRVRKVISEALLKCRKSSTYREKVRKVLSEVG